MQNLKPHTLCLSLALLGCSFPSYAQLMFSQYIDGTGSRKGLEIYNQDASTVNLADYQIQLYSNGKTTPTTVDLQDLLATKAKFIVGSTELQAEIGNKLNQVANALSFNGDDALVLVYKRNSCRSF